VDADDIEPLGHTSILGLTHDNRSGCCCQLATPPNRLQIIVHDSK
jgi:hypothetical protein